MTHPLMAFERISVPTPESERTDRGPAPWHDDPAFGGLDEDQATVLADSVSGRAMASSTREEGRISTNLGA